LVERLIRRALFVAFVLFVIFGWLGLVAVVEAAWRWFWG